MKEGYLLVDLRHAPGPGGVTFLEAAVMTCPHCQRQLIRNPARTRERAFCMKCNHYICDECGVAKECVPYAKRLDDLETSLLRQRSF